MAESRCRAVVVLSAMMLLVSRRVWFGSSAPKVAVQRRVEQGRALPPRWSFVLVAAVAGDSLRLP